MEDSQHSTHHYWNAFLVPFFFLYAFLLLFLLMGLEFCHFFPPFFLCGWKNVPEENEGWGVGIVAGGRRRVKESIKDDHHDEGEEKKKRGNHISSNSPLSFFLVF